MSPICCIVPEYVLEAVIEKGNASEAVLDACRSTIAHTEQIRNARSEHCEETAHAQPSLLAAQDITQKKLSRKVYDAQHSRNERNPPRNKIVIQEGGGLLSLSIDPSQDANECYIGFEKTYNFYTKFFNRNSIDGKGLPLDGFVHFGRKYQNAFWDGKQMIFGEGDGEIFNGFTDELDVIAHELTHGVVEYASPLNYQFQSGALNESMADVFGIMVKQWGENPESPQTVDQSNWLIGEGIFARGINGRALRDMKNPGTAYDDNRVGNDQQPGHWRDFKRLPISRDQGGVHINSGIPNHAFYLAATKIGGYAWEGAGQVWYKALASGDLGQDATFKEFADLTIKNAGEHLAQVKAAWDEVGYPFPEDADEL